MTSVLGQNDNNGSVVGPENNPTVDADQTTEITSSTTYTPIAPTGNVLVIAGGGGGGQNGGGERQRDAGRDPESVRAEYEQRECSGPWLFL